MKAIQEILDSSSMRQEGFEPLLRPPPGFEQSDSTDSTDSTHSTD